MRFLLIIGMTACFSAIAYGQSNEVLLKKADSLSVAGKTADAIALYSKIIKAEPRKEMAWRGRAKTYLQMNKFAEAEKDYKQALQINPSCGNCYAYLSLIRMINEDLPAAVSLAKKGVKAEPLNSITHQSLARVLTAENKYDEALAAYQQSIKLDSANADAFYYRALLHIDRGEMEKAMQDFNAAIRINPGFSDAYLQRAIVLANNQKFDEAIRDVSIATQKDSSNGEAYKLLANIYYYKEQSDSSIKYYSKALALNPKDYESYYFRSKSWYSLENMDASCKDLKATILNAPKSPDESASAIIEDAQGWIRESCDSAYPGYYYQRGIAAYNLGRYNEAIEIYNRGLAKFPEHSMMNSFRGNARLAAGKYKEAEADYIKSLQIKNNLKKEVTESWAHHGSEPFQMDMFVNGTILTMYNSLAEARINLGNYTAAEADLEEAFKMPENVPGKDQSYVLKGVMYINKNDNSSALNAFNKAIGLNPENHHAYTNRAIVKMNLAYKTQVISFSGMGMNGIMQLPPREKTTVNRDNFASALADVNKAIAANKNYGYAYYVRAMVKMALGEADYCYDLLKADQLGLAGMKELLKTNQCK